MKLLILFTFGIIAGLICLPLTATLRERIRLAVREFRAGWYGSGGYEARGGGDVASDDSEVRMIIPTASEIVIRVEPLP